MTNDADGLPARAWCSCGWELAVIDGDRMRPMYVFIQWFAHASRCGERAAVRGVVEDYE